MSISVMAFVAMALVSMLFLAALVAGELNLKLRTLTQTGDSSLSPNSVNWLGALAFGCAVLICMV